VSLDHVVAKRSRATKVIRKSQFVRGSDGHGDGSQTETIAVVALSFQPTTTPSRRLSRQIDGDETEGEARVHVTESAVAAAYLDGDITKTPLGWTSLRIAPPEGAEGPPGDSFEAQGVRWELTEQQSWQLEGFNGPSGFRRYIARERGAATL
jgi:hypothetical protein